MPKVRLPRFTWLFPSLVNKQQQKNYPPKLVILHLIQVLVQLTTHGNVIIFLGQLFDVNNENLFSRNETPKSFVSSEHRLQLSRKVSLPSKALQQWHIFLTTLSKVYFDMVLTTIMGWSHSKHKLQSQKLVHSSSSQFGNLRPHGNTPLPCCHHRSNVTIQL